MAKKKPLNLDSAIAAYQWAAKEFPPSILAEQPKDGKAMDQPFIAGFAFALAFEPAALMAIDSPYRKDRFWAIYSLPQLCGKRKKRKGSDDRQWDCRISNERHGFANRALKAIQAAEGACPSGADEKSRAWHAGAEIARASDLSLKIGQDIGPDFQKIEDACPLDNCAAQAHACIKSGKNAIRGYSAGLDWLAEQAAKADIKADEPLLIEGPQAEGPQAEAPKIEAPKAKAKAKASKAKASKAKAKAS